MQISSNNFLKYFVIIFFFIYFVFGLLVYKDFGITTDEEFQRFSGFYWLNYVLSFTSFEDIKLLVETKLNSIDGFTLPDPVDFPFYGVIFDLPLALIETLLNIENSKDYFLLRHFCNFLIFFISAIFFFRILRDRFDKNIVILFGLLFYIGSPRIFGDSFFNNKDVVFLSLVTIAIFYGFKLINKFNFKNILLFGIFSAIATSSRIIGIFLPISLLAIIVFGMLDKKIDANQIKKILFLILSYFVFTIIFWPYLWGNPIINFIKAISIFSNYIIDIKFLFNGSYVSSTSLPFTYLPIWILITTPIIIILYFLIGYFLFAKKIFNNLIKMEEKKQNDIWKNLNEKKDFFIFFNFSVIIIFLILSSPVLYNGWRQVYFVNTFIVYLASYGFFQLVTSFKTLKNFKRWFYLITTIFLINIYYEMYKFHPYQSLYFNKLVGKNLEKKFEIDYWGLAGRKALEEILVLKKKDKISIGVASWVPLERSLVLFNSIEKKRVEIVGQNYEEAEYIFLNNITEVNSVLNEKYKIPKNFTKISELTLNNSIVYSIYKNLNF